MNRESRDEHSKPQALVTAPSVCRVILDSQPRSGQWNMSLDHALLNSAVHRGECTVRVYRWSEPTVSLGYFQKSSDHSSASPLNSLPQVNRLTGGGAILHHHEWTYSCAIPAGHPAVRVPGELYAAVHRQIIAVLKTLGVTAHLRSDTTAPDTAPASSPFLCFHRGDPNDIVLFGRKIVGSAQRRRKGAVLQHGSILLRKSKYAADIPGIADLLDDFDPSDLQGKQLLRAIASIIAENTVDSRPTKEELASCRETDF